VAALAFPFKEEAQDDFVGMEALHELFDHYIEVLKSPEEAKKCGMKLPAGLLLYGPPGCGKTYAAKHFPRYAKTKGLLLKFHQVRNSDVASQWRGEAILKMRKIFEEAKRTKPSILFIDECEGLFPSRDKFGNTFGAERTQELDEMLQLLEEAKEDGVIVVAATNHLASIDRAIFRTGRFDFSFEVKPPDAVMRRKMFEAKLRLRNVDQNLDLEHIVGITDGFTASDIETMVNTSAVESWKTKVPISLHHLMVSFAAISTKKIACQQVESLMPCFDKESL
jgi:transitional endoplasmic reticulum ATPase